MNFTFDASETRLVQVKNAISAANADSLSVGSGVPKGKLWIILGFGYYPSTAETQVVSIYKSIPFFGQNFGLLNPVSLALNPHVATFIEQGMDYVLMPDEVITVLRGNHTAGSTMSVNMQFIEVDQPLYAYEDPQVVLRNKRAVSSIKSIISRRGGVGGTGGGRSGAGPIGHGGGGGTSIPV